MKKTLCLLLALLSFGCMAASARTEGNYYLNIERENLETARWLYTFAHDNLNLDGELDYLSERAADCAQKADEIQLEIERGHDLNDVKKADEPEDSGIALQLGIFLAAAVIIAFVMLWLQRKSKKGVNGMKLRDIRRALLKYRYLILAAGLVCTAAAMLLVRPGKSAVDSAFPPVPDTDGEYIAAVEALADYCDEISELDSSIASRAEEVKYYQLSYAMSEILSSRAAKNADEIAAVYRVRAERLRIDMDYSDRKSWQDYTEAITGPKEDYAAMIEEYLVHNLDARLLELDVARCENIADIMEKGGPPSEGATRRIEGYISTAAERLRELTAPVIPNEPVMPYEAAAALGFVTGIILASLGVMLAAVLRLSLRRNGQRKQTKNSPYRELMESINSRG